MFTHLASLAPLNQLAADESTLGLTPDNPAPLDLGVAAGAVGILVVLFATLVAVVVGKVSETSDVIPSAAPSPPAVPTSDDPIEAALDGLVAKLSGAGQAPPEAASPPSPEPLMPFAEPEAQPQGFAPAASAKGKKLKRKARRKGSG